MIIKGNQREAMGNYLHDAFQSCSYIETIVNKDLFQHPAVQAYPEIKKKVEIAAHKLAEALDLIQKQSLNIDVKIKRRRLTNQEVDQIRELSKNHTLRQISQITGWGRMTVSNVQKNPKNKIEKPFRKQIKRTDFFENKAGKYFNIDQWQKEMSY